MFASFQSLGNTPEFSESWKIFVRVGANVSAQFLSTALGMASGPHAFLGLIFFSNLATPEELMTMSLIGSYVGVFIGGGGDPSSGVNTDWN